MQRLLILKNMVKKICHMHRELLKVLIYHVRTYMLQTNNVVTQGEG